MIIPLKNGKFQVKSHDGKRSFGVYDSRKGAEHRLKQIEYFKKKKNA